MSPPNCKPLLRLLSSFDSFSAATLKQKLQSERQYGCESLAMTAETNRRVQTFKTKCFKQMLRISWKDRKSNDFVRSQRTTVAGHQEPLLALVKKRKLQQFGHVIHHKSLPKTVLQGTLKGSRQRGRQTKGWVDNIKEWTSLDCSTLVLQGEDRAG